MTPRYNEFLSGMNSVYDRFRANPPSVLGTQVGGIVTKNHRLYAAVMRYDARVNDYVSGMSEQIARITPSLQYVPNTVHTTLLDTIPDGDIDGSIERALHSMNNDDFHNLSVGFETPISNRDSVILPGTPTVPFVFLSQAMYDSIQTSNPTGASRLKKPWGAHSTVGRYLSLADKETGNEVMQILSRYPGLGTVNPVSIEVWSGNIGPEGFSRTMLAERKIPQ